MELWPRGGAALVNLSDCSVVQSVTYSKRLTTDKQNKRFVIPPRENLVAVREQHGLPMYLNGLASFIVRR